MKKFYCTNCMKLLEESYGCSACGNKEVKVINISIQTNQKKEG